MKKIINKFAIWLYIKTRDGIKVKESLLNGINVFKRRCFPFGKCIIREEHIEEEINMFIESILDKEITSKTSNIKHQKQGGDNND